METEVRTVEFESFEEYEEAFDKQWEENTNKAAELVEGFMRIGYLLKKARDTDILKDTVYTDYIDFAKKKYDIGKDVVSRYININNTFSEGGNSMTLKEGYRGFGYAKLALMLTLPEEIRGEISPEYSKSEIQTIKDEVEEEKKISDLEVMIEREPEVTQGHPIFAKAALQLFEMEPELYKEVHAAFRAGGDVERAVYEIMAPNEEKLYIVRVPGVGKLTLRISKDTVSVQNMRDAGENSKMPWEKAVKEIQEHCIDIESDSTAEENWEDLYGREFPKVAPVQPEKPAARKESKVHVVKEQNREPEKTTGNQVEEPEETAEIQNAEPEEEKGDAAVEEDSKEDDLETEADTMEDDNGTETIPDEGEVPGNDTEDGTGGVLPVQRQQQRLWKMTYLNTRKQEIKGSILQIIVKLPDELEQGYWNLFKAHITEIKSDIERIEKIEQQITDAKDTSQMSLEDYIEEEQ